MLETAEKTIRILLVDDHTLFRESVSRLLGAEPGLKMAGHCGSIEEGLQILREKAVDIVLLDFDLGHNDGREFLRLTKEQGFQGKVLVVTAGVDASAATEMIRAGVSGIFRKHDSAALLAQGIRDVMAGKVWFSKEQLQTAMSSDISSQDPTRHFTERERQVLACVFEGLANKEIAARIAVSESSVKATLQQLFSKTGVRTRSQLVRIVLEHHRNQL